MNLEGKAAVVTGAGTGVGAATAKLLASRRCAVVVNYRQSKDEADQVVADINSNGGQALAVQGDVAVDDDAVGLIEQAVGAFGRLDVLINNAAVTEFIRAADFDALTDEVWHKLMQVNVVGVFHCVRAAAPVMKQSGGGAIVNVSSIAGWLASGSSIAYCASKAALNNLTVALARELGPEIRVNAVSPGPITGRWMRSGLGERYEQVVEGWAEAIPLKKVSDPSDIAAAIVALIEGGDLVTGQNLVVDGGTMITPPVRL